jgi:hypothetical protein
MYRTGESLGGGFLHNPPLSQESRDGFYVGPRRSVLTAPIRAPTLPSPATHQRLHPITSASYPPPHA